MSNEVEESRGFGLEAASIHADTDMADAAAALVDGEGEKGGEEEKEEEEQTEKKRKRETTKEAADEAGVEAKRNREKAEEEMAAEKEAERKKLWDYIRGLNFCHYHGNGYEIGSSASSSKTGIVWGCWPATLWLDYIINACPSAKIEDFKNQFAKALEKAHAWRSAEGDDVQTLKRGFAELTQGSSKGGRRAEKDGVTERQLYCQKSSKESGLTKKDLGVRPNALLGSSLALCAVVRLLARDATVQRVLEDPIFACECLCDYVLGAMDKRAAQMQDHTEQYACMDAERRAVHRISLAVTMARFHMNNADSGYANLADQQLRAELVTSVAEAAAWPHGRTVGRLSQNDLCGKWITSEDFKTQFMPKIPSPEAVPSAPTPLPLPLPPDQPSASTPPFPSPADPQDPPPPLAEGALVLAPGVMTDVRAALKSAFEADEYDDSRMTEVLDAGVEKALRVLDGLEANDDRVTHLLIELIQWVILYKNESPSSRADLLQEWLEGRLREWIRGQESDQTRNQKKERASIFCKAVENKELPDETKKYAIGLLLSAGLGQDHKEEQMQLYLARRDFDSGEERSVPIGFEDVHIRFLEGAKELVWYAFMDGKRPSNPVPNGSYLVDLARFCGIDTQQKAGGALKKLGKVASEVNDFFWNGDKKPKNGTYAYSQWLRFDTAAGWLQQGEIEKCRKAWENCINGKANTKKKKHAHAPQLLTHQGCETESKGTSSDSNEAGDEEEVEVELGCGNREQQGAKAVEVELGCASNEQDATALLYTFFDRVIKTTDPTCGACNTARDKAQPSKREDYTDSKNRSKHSDESLQNGCVACFLRKHSVCAADLDDEGAMQKLRLLKNTMHNAFVKYMLDTNGVRALGDRNDGKRVQVLLYEPERFYLPASGKPRKFRNDKGKYSKAYTGWTVDKDKMKEIYEKVKAAENQDAAWEALMA